MQVLLEPPRSARRDGCERPWFLKETRGPWDDLQGFVTAELGIGRPQRESERCAARLVVLYAVHAWPCSPPEALVWKSAVVRTALARLGTSSTTSLVLWYTYSHNNFSCILPESH